MTRRGRFMTKSAGCVVAALPLVVLGCQDQGRPDSMPNANGTPNEKVTQAPMKLDDSTKTNIVLRQLHAANQEEVDLGKIAVDKAQNADVKKFAQDMVSDHSAADGKLTALAKRMNIDLGMSALDPVEKALSEASDDGKRTLRGQTGTSFDVAYIAPQVDKHTFALKLLEQGQKTASGDVKSLLEEMRPTVEGHLDHAKNVMRLLTFSGAAIGGGPAVGEPTPGQVPPAVKHPMRNKPAEPVR
jgi:putative membrane protein